MMETDLLKGKACLMSTKLVLNEGEREDQKGREPQKE